MTLLTIGAILCISLEVYTLTRIKENVQFTLEKRQLYLHPDLTEDQRIRQEATLLVKYIGAIQIIVGKFYLLFILLLGMTKFWYIGIILMAMAIAKPLITKTFNKDKLLVYGLADSWISITLLVFIAWNRPF